MFGRIGFRIALGLLLTVALVGGAVAIGWSAYNTGVAQGAAQAGSQLAPPADGPGPVYTYGPYRSHPFGFGFGFLGCLGPLLFLFLIFGLFRLLFWGGMGHHRHGGWGPKGPFTPEEFRDHWREQAETWHREQHGERPAEASGHSTSAT
ncbi:MAG: hypothetical protein A2Z17_06645 [Gammaproteobacteria bacterium RBG_16_66_13]|nr:MAG: hypothetical protein A2Z17_06645 [Gammaproteobacteria bacterium RBG_16_66_13]